MRIASCVILASALLVGCGDDGGNSGDDAPADAAEATHFMISFMVRGDVPLLLAVKDYASDTWTSITPTAANMYTAMVTKRHEIAMVCGAPGSYQNFIEARLNTDAAPFLFCFNDPVATSTTYHATGSMLQEGQVSLRYSTQKGTTSPWSFDLEVSEGTHDLIAITDGNIYVRKNIAVDGPTTIADVDVTQGMNLSTHLVQVANRNADETVYTELDVGTGNASSTYIREGMTVREAPDAVIGNGYQVQYVGSTTSTTDRRLLLTGETNAVLMDRLEGVTFSGFGASWPSLPPSTAEVSVGTFTPDNSMIFSATGGYIAGAKTMTASVDTLPGYDAAWTVSNGPTVLHRMTASDDELGSSQFYSLPQTTARGVPEAALAAVSRLPLDRVQRARNVAAAFVRARP
jgi:hypothetical protein